MQWKRWLGITALVAGVVLLVAYGFRTQPVPVETTEVSRGPLRVTVEEEGKTRVIDRFVVSAPVAGIAPRIMLNVGDPVTKGQTLLQLEPLRSDVLDSRRRAEAEARITTAEAALEAAAEQVKRADVDVSYWETELGRVQQLFEAGITSKDNFDRTQTEARRAEAARRSALQAVVVARTELASARVTLQHSAATESRNPGETVTVRFPVSGRVLRLVHESEGVVRAGEPLLEIANAQSLEVEVEVLSADAVRIGPGTRVLFERWGGENPLEGRVRLVEPVAFTKFSALGVEEQRVRVIVDITSPPETWERLGDGYRVEASFVLWESGDVLQIPSSALFRYQQGWAVFAIDGILAQRRAVEVDHRNGLAAEILSGLQQGEAVITHPDDSIEDGTTVEVREP